MINNSLKNITHFFKHTHIGVPILLLCVLAMIILPLSPLVLDILFTFNIVLSVLVLLVSVNSKRPLDFAVFPTIELAPYFMMYTNLMTYPLKFRQHVLAIKEKLTYAKTASRFGVGMASLMRWNRRITPLHDAQ